jgi:hypothetical protein
MPVRPDQEANDEVERRGGALPANEADLSQSSILSLAKRSRGPRSLEPIVRCLRWPAFLALPTNIELAWILLTT